MQTPVYRNLDKPLRIMGFSIFELLLLCLSLVGGGEIVQLFGIPRILSFIFTLTLAFGFLFGRRSLGDSFAKRLIRFIQLPSQLSQRLIVLRKKS